MWYGLLARSLDHPRHSLFIFLLLVGLPIGALMSSTFPLAVPNGARREAFSIGISIPCFHGDAPATVR